MGFLTGFLVKFSIWILKIKYRKEIESIKSGSPFITDDIALTMILGKEVYEHKVQILCVISIVGIIFVIVVILLCIIFISTFTGYMQNINGIICETVLSILGKGNIVWDPEIGGWTWVKADESQDEDLVGSGGLYPKDKKLKLLAELIEILKKSSNDAKEYTGVYVDPAWMLGTIIRESGNRLINEINTEKYTSIFKELMVMNPPCGKSNCSYINNGHSHFVGGTVKNGVDMGDPYTQIINMDNSLYDGDHAVGQLQFEMPGAYGELNRVYGKPTAILGSDYKSTASTLVKMDNNLGFIRPNPFYTPDAVYSGTFKMAGAPRENSQYPSNYKNMLNSKEFKSLNKQDQDFIKFMYASTNYGRGHIRGSDDDMAEALIKLAKSGGINLDEMGLDLQYKYWNSSTKTRLGSMTGLSRDINDRYGLGIDTDRVSWYGVYSACIGRIGYNDIVKAIDAAEKEGYTIGGPGSANGNWIGRPGSGVFGGSGTEFYVDDLGIRWYHQSENATNPKARAWSRLIIGSGKPMSKSGCGIYTMAMIASNLFNKDITPDQALALAKSKPSVIINGMLGNAGVDVLANDLGLKTKKINITNRELGLQEINKELDLGNMILFVSVGGPYPWYGGDGHFMAVRGYDKINGTVKYHGITSANNSKTGAKALDIMKIPIDGHTWLKSVSRTYVWVVGLPENIN